MTHNYIIFYAFSYSTVFSCYLGFSTYFRGLRRLIEFMSCDVVRTGNDFFLMIFSYFFIKKVNLFAEFSLRCKYLPTFSNTVTINSMLYPLRLSIRFSMQAMVFSTSMTLNLVNSHMYFMILLFLSLSTKVVAVVSLILSYYVNMISLIVSPISL